MSSNWAAQEKQAYIEYIIQPQQKNTETYQIAGTIAQNHNMSVPSKGCYVIMTTIGNLNAPCCVVIYYGCV
ncbi:MAG TPA: hypothetical protein DHW02_01505, partial [Ktedonobacter sp.]|nr:hypothetical protein [Ktedonobacter sp.]